MLNKFLPDIYVARRSDLCEPSSRILRPAIGAFVNIAFGSAALFAIVFSAVAAARIALMTFLLLVCMCITSVDAAPPRGNQKQQQQQRLNIQRQNRNGGGFNLSIPYGQPYYRPQPYYGSPYYRTYPQPYYYGPNGFRLYLRF